MGMRRSQNVEFFQQYRLVVDMHSVLKTGRGRGDSGTRGRGDARTRGGGTRGRRNSETRGDSRT